ncbi:glycolate oxidase iron-sulfur subunit [Methyloglobulus morosus KoM1]|uniref:Glycolate oxidase iron-sulfur subunit n=1 Tax=Methyloglobulus morosus KoM1 TaxID=1116472 RepID=V5BIQ2_9GAMM|nr:glycolate oxidase subunit GlcF [Methyloglobulus morosus]ESS73180.1 glycolate oxidase iron-sulfur subunit [Methyloglobulus morosus KoM1]
MYSQFSTDFNDTPEIQEAQDILRRCVHCGFCNATCPTYQLKGDELDGPRGRIYLIKQMFEGGAVTQQTQLHLDRCLSCKSCETTCPSGVEFGRLADIGRHLVDQKVQRSLPQRLFRRVLLWWLPYPKRFKRLIQLARVVRPLLPVQLKNKIPSRQPDSQCQQYRHVRSVLLLDGCVQQTLAPKINASTAHVLDQLGISAIRLPNAGCCGALNYHLSDQSGGLDKMRRMIDACWPQIESGVEAIVMTASGCGAMLKDYGKLLRDDPVYANKAERYSALCKDISEVLSNEDLSKLTITPRKIAFQSPCSLQHAQGLNGVTEALLTKLGFCLTPVQDAHLCCGSAGTYSILQPEIADQLRSRKLHNLQQDQPELIATANIGCLLHLQEKSDIPVMHWIELLD